MEQIGLLLGSFDPIHRAHVALGVWALERVDRLWVVPSPGNPLKNEAEASWEDRLAMIGLAFEGVERVEVCAVERELPAPHFTIQTIEYLQKKHPDKKFSIVCGGDIVRQLPQWHRTEELQRLVSFLVYPRGEGGEGEWVENSTEVRSGAHLDYLDDRVRGYIEAHGLYYAGVLHQAQAAFAQQRFGTVLNLAAHYPDNKPLEQLATMTQQVLDFRHTDLYNP